MNAPLKMTAKEMAITSHNLTRCGMFADTKEHGRYVWEDANAAWYRLNASGVVKMLAEHKDGYSAKRAGDYYRWLAGKLSRVARGAVASWASRQGPYYERFVADSFRSPKDAT